MRTPKLRVQQTQGSGLTKLSKSLPKHWQKRIHDGPEPTTTELQTKHNKELTSHMKQPCLNSKPKSTTNTRRCSNGATKTYCPNPCQKCTKIHKNMKQKGKRETHTETQQSKQEQHTTRIQKVHSACNRPTPCTLLTPKMFLQPEKLES